MSIQKRNTQGGIAALLVGLCALKPVHADSINMVVSDPVRVSPRGSSPHMWWSMAASPTDSGHLVVCAIRNDAENAVAMQGVLYGSDDGGANWHTLYQNTRGQSASEIHCAQGDDGGTYFSYSSLADLPRALLTEQDRQDRQKLQLLKSLDFGGTWSKVSEGAYVDSTTLVLLPRRGSEPQPLFIFGDLVGDALGRTVSRVPGDGTVLRMPEPPHRDPRWVSLLAGATTLPDGNVGALFWESASRPPPSGTTAKLTPITLNRVNATGKSVGAPIVIAQLAEEKSASLALGAARQPSIAVGKVPDAKRARTYVVWSQSVSGRRRVQLVHSDDSGLTWSKPAAIDDSGERSLTGYSSVAVNNTGVVAVKWAEQEGRCWRISISRDGGNTFSASVPLNTCTTEPPGYTNHLNDYLYSIPTATSAEGRIELTVLNWHLYEMLARGMDLVTTPDGAFHATWNSAGDALYTTRIDVSEAAVAQAEKLRTLASGPLGAASDDLWLDYSHLAFDENTRELTVRAALRSSHPATAVPGTVLFKASSLASVLGKVTPLNADNGAVWVFAGPGEPRTLRFQIAPSDQEPKTPQRIFERVAQIKGEVYRPGAPSASKLKSNSRAMLAMAHVRGWRDVLVAIAAQPHRVNFVRAAIEAAGGKTRVLDEEYDYIRARVPLDRVAEVAQQADILAIDVEENYYKTNFDGVTLRTLPPRPENQPVVDAKEAFEKPYLPDEDVGATRLKSAHPTFDGRGATVAVIDQIFDFTRPELQDANSLEGRQIRKVSDIIAVTDEDDGDPFWIDLRDRVVSRHGKFAYAGSQYHAPADGRFFIGFFDADATSWGDISVASGRVKLQTKPDSPRRVAVLCDLERQRAWVDVNQNGDFTDEVTLSDYRSTGAHARFPIEQDARHQNVAEPSIAFTAQFDPGKQRIRLNFGMSMHATMVAGSAAGSGFDKGRFNSLAPGAQLVSVAPSYTQHSFIEAVLRAVRMPAVDVIVLEPVPPVPDTADRGGSTAAIMLDRIARMSAKPIVCPGGNMPVTSQMIDYGLLAHVLSIGAYQNSESYRINYGVSVAQRDGISTYGPVGPTWTGRLKPDVVAPIGIITSHPGYLPGGDLPGGSRLPPGYLIGSGTSQGAPVAASALAVLVSAAKQSGVAWNAQSLMDAITTSARFLPEVPTQNQGNGLFQLDAAWERLQRLASNHTPVVIDSSGPLAVRVETSGIAPGIFEREGWAVGDRGVRQIQLTRTSGGPEASEYLLSWSGNETGVFQTAAKIELPLNQTVTLPVAIQPRTPGAHNAFLRVQDPHTLEDVLRVPVAVIATQPLLPENAYSACVQLLKQGPLASHVFCRSDGDAKNLIVDIENPERAVLAAANWRPTGQRYGEYKMGEFFDEAAWSFLLEHPAAGVWETFIENTKFRAPIPLNVCVSAHSFTVHPELSKGTVDVTSHGAPFVGGISEPELVSARTEEFEIPATGYRAFEIDTPPNTARLHLSVRSENGASDVYLFKVVEGHQIFWTISDAGDSTHHLDVASPGAGHWVALVAAADPAKPVSVRYTDWFTRPDLGGAQSDDADARHRDGETWHARVHVSVPAPEQGERRAAISIPIHRTLKEFDGGTRVDVLERRVFGLDGVEIE